MAGDLWTTQTTEWGPVPIVGRAVSRSAQLSPLRVCFSRAQTLPGWPMLSDSSTLVYKGPGTMAQLVTTLRATAALQLWGDQPRPRGSSPHPMALIPGLPQRMSGMSAPSNPSQGPL